MNVKIKDQNGDTVEIPVEASLYKEAHKANMTVPQFLNSKYPTDAEKYGTAFEQACESTGLLMNSDHRYGLRTPSVEQVIEGTARIDAASITRDQTPASRILFPAVFLEVIENQLAKERESQPAIFEKMIAISDTIAGARFDQPVLDFSKPEAARSMGVSQLALPNAMLRITASDVSRKIPTFSIGMEMSDEAAKVTSIDFTALSLARQVAVERDTRVEGYISAMVTGDADNAVAALSSATTTSFDAAATGGVVTQKAWVKYLFNKRRQRTIDYIMCDIDTALKIDGRTGRPTVYTANDPNYPYNSIANPLNLSIQNVKVFIVDVGVIAADTIVGIDSRYAIRRVRNSEAEYQAAEEFVMKRGIAMRFDFGEIVYRLYDDAWSVMTIA